MKIPKPKRTKSKKALKKIRDLKCLVCNTEGDVHHIQSRGSGGGDEEHNLMPLCRLHHAEVHQMGLYKFCMTYWMVPAFLFERGWECEVIAPGCFKWTHS